MRRSHWSIAPLLLLAGCIPAAPRPAAPVAPPPAPPPPPPVAATPAPTADWRDVPLTPGAWSYRRDNAATAALFGAAGAAPAFSLQCNRTTHTITLSRPGTAAGPMTVTTSYGVKSWPATPTPDGRVAVTLTATDPALDQIAFSRGRFAVAGAGLPTLFLPSWAEPARVIEDCRG